MIAAADSDGPGRSENLGAPLAAAEEYRDASLPLRAMSPRALIRRPFDDLMAATAASVGAGHPARVLAATMLGFTVTWFAYVPVHELLHALGCWASGGSVTRLEVDPWYGGAWLAKIFPFVVAGGEYAGRLVGFDTHGSDWVYLATDATPFGISVLVGVPLLRACARRPRPLLFGTAAVLSFASFCSIPGDYYEMASILTTRAASWLAGGTGLALESFRSDDVLRLVEVLLFAPAELGIGGAGAMAAALVLIGCSLVLAVLLACATYGLGVAAAEVFSHAGFWRRDATSEEAAARQRRSAGGDHSE